MNRKAVAGSREAQGGPTHARKRGGRAWPPLALFAVAAVALALFLWIGPPDTARWDDDVCPVDGPVSARAAYLIDARKPLDADLAELPGRLLERVSMDLEAGTELRVYALADLPDAPRRFVGRVCKPYANSDLQVSAAKDQTTTFRDCDDLPAQVPPDLREAASAFCVRRDALRARIDAITTPSIGEPIAHAYLAEAIEASVTRSATAPAADSVYVFSDMMQHAEAFSHVDSGPDGWRIERFRRAAAGVRGAGYDAPWTGRRITVFYLPRTGLTDEPGTEMLHKRFWRALLAGAEVTFRNQPPSLGYASDPPAAALPPEEDPPPEEDDPAPAPDPEADRLLAELAEREDELAAAERRLSAQRDADRRQHDERLAALATRERALAERLAVLDREAAASADAPASADEEPASDGPTPASGVRDPLEGPAVSPGGLASPDAAQDAADPPGSEEAADAVASGEPDASGLEAPQPAEPGQPLLPSPTVALPVPELCDLAHGAGNAMPDYPSRRYIGNATVVVEFMVDETGATLDDSITVVRARSSAERPHRFERFRDAAIDVVRGWEFTSATETACQMAQTVVAPIAFRAGGTPR